MNFAVPSAEAGEIRGAAAVANEAACGSCSRRSIGFPVMSI